MFIVKYRHIFYWITGVIVALALGAIAIFGLQLGIEFRGGAILEVSYEDERPAQERVEEAVANTDIEQSSVRGSGDSGYIIRTPSLAEEQRQSLMDSLSIGDATATQERFSSIGPVISSELRTKAFIAMGTVVIALVLFIAYVFRHVSEPVSSWKYGFIAILALLHDILLPVGLFAVLGYLVGAEVDVLFVMALLAILGYSVNDTIVVLDRVRENLRQNQDLNISEDFELTVGKSLNQTFTRSINTSLTSGFVLLALFFVGAETTRHFALVLLAGVAAGTYSSLCLATPLLVTIHKYQQKKAKHG
jgi:preprotein translocase subunit SecF